ncbi:MAG: polysaccharide deacetylase family protein [candidate division WOR-3 bacterium]|nr:polysaccharide deacetylase family protein [candidate division WOR-3 bacterium]MDW8113649.1 polysaccharide deacetylase family protein [candidate division WOR-3 bacterium]
MINKEIEILVNEKDFGFLEVLKTEQPYGLKIVKEDLKSNIEVYYQKRKIGEIFDITKLENHLKEIKIKKRYLKYFLPEEKPIYWGIEIIDIFDNLFLLNKEKKIVYFLDNKIYLPFSLENLLKSSERKAKYFYFSLLKFPYEFVNKINKGALRRLVINLLINIFFKNKIPYFSLSYFPDNYHSVFLFRVDGDFAKRKEVEKVFEFLNKENIKFTFFVDVKASERFLDFFKEKNREKFDIQLHSYYHYVYKDKDRNLENLLIGKKKLMELGIEIKGFAAPFGIWNYSLNEVLEDLHFSYSSEFGFDYDDLPILPIVNNRFSYVYQIPIHPISIGCLKILNLSQKEMIKYYQEYILKTYEKGYPIVLYDHPEKILEFSDVFKEVFDFIKNLSNIKIMNFTEFFEWWQKREKMKNYEEKKLDFPKIETKIGYTRKKEFYLKVKSLILSFHRFRKGR